MLSDRQKVEKLAGLLSTKDLTDWEREFVGSVVARMQTSKTASLTEKQSEIVGRIHDRHFA